MFSIGKKVEVSFEKEDLSDVWFPATVLKCLGNNSFLVECQRLGINDEIALHKVVIDYLHIRPPPPLLRDKEFVLLEKVDAFYDNGWWSGVITKELADNRYIVFFKQTNKERDFSHSELRPHMKWEDGKWFSASQDTPCNDVDSTENDVMLGKSDHVKSDTGGITTSATKLVEKPIEQITLGIDKEYSVITSLMKRKKQTSLDSNDKHPKHSTRLKGTFDDPSVVLDEIPKKEINNLPFDHSGGFNSEDAVISDQAVVKTRILSCTKKMRSKRGKGVERESPTTNSTRRGRLAAVLRSPKPLVQALTAATRDSVKITTKDIAAVLRSPKPLVHALTAATRDSVKITTKDIVEKEHVSKELASPVVIGLPSNGMKVSRGRKLQHMSSERTAIVGKGETQQSGVMFSPSATLNMEGEEKQIDAVTITPKRKRGRPPKSKIKRPETSSAVGHLNGDVTPGAAPVVEDSEINASETEMEVPLYDKNNLPNGRSVQVLYSRREKDKSSRGKRGRRRTMSINTTSAQESQDVSNEKADGGLEENSSQRNPELSLDKLLELPLSSWFQVGHSSTTVDRADVSLQRGVEQSSKASEGRLIDEHPAAAANGDNLPFVRNTPLWETIESMEAFRMIPQKPHFRPLDGVKESAREGLAIGCMVNFSSVVKKTSALQINDPRNIFEDCLETLAELEIHGFSVNLIRHRLTNLLMIKDKQEGFQEKSKELKDKMEEENVENEKFNQEIEVIDKQIRELQERRAEALSKREKQISEIATMKAEVDGLKHELSEAQLEFEGLATAPW